MIQILLVPFIFWSSIGRSCANTTESDLLNVTDTSDIFMSYLEGKDESLSDCKMFTIDRQLYEILPDGSALIAGKEIRGEKFYILMNDTLSFCNLPPVSTIKVNEPKVLSFAAYITLIGLVISMICLFLHLVVFCMVPDLRNLPGWNLATLCACLFLSYLVILIIGSDYTPNHSDACAALGPTAQFLLFSSFLWMSIMSFDVFMSLLRATGSFRSSSTHFSKRKFGLYCLCAFGISLLFCIFAVLADNLDVLPEKYRPEFRKFCWIYGKIPLLIFFGGPVIFLSCLNFILFGATAYVIHVNKRNHDQDAQQSTTKTRYSMYFRLSVIMGVTWIFAIVANIFDQEWVWMIFILLNTLQGLFIFLAFTCSEKVKKYFRQKFVGDRQNSKQSLTPTFQSYCSYSNSTETEINKTVDSGK